MGTYVQLTRDEFEDWLDDIGFRGKWKLKPGRGGVYQLKLSKVVAIEINSTTGTAEEVMGRARASMKLRLVSLVTGRTLNKKSMGQSHFKRTLNWRQTWAKGVDRMKDAYMKSRSWYDQIAAIEDRDQYKADLLAEIEAIPGWESDRFLSDLHGKVERGGVLSEKQRAAIRRSRDAIGDEEVVETESTEADEAAEAELERKLGRLRNLWVAARRAADQWTMDFVKSVADRLKDGRSLTDRQDEIVADKLRRYRIASVRDTSAARVATTYLIKQAANQSLTQPLSLRPDYGTNYDTLSGAVREVHEDDDTPAQDRSQT
jgi:hypothetical protein